MALSDVLGSDTPNEGRGKINTNNTRVRRLLDAVSGGEGFSSETGAVTLDLSDEATAGGRAFLLTATGDLTLTFDNIPNGSDHATAWTVAIKMDATGGHSTSITNSITALYEESLSDLDTSGNAVNLLWFIRIGGVTYWTLYYNGAVALDATTMFFSGNSDPETVARPFDRSVSVELSSVTHRALDGTSGGGTISFEKNGSSASGTTSFAADDVLAVKRTGSTSASCIAIPVYLA